VTQAAEEASGNRESIGTNEGWMDYLPAMGALFVVLAGWLASHYLISCLRGVASCKQHVPYFSIDTINHPLPSSTRIWGGSRRSPYSW
jgi:hypothetical protein